MCLLRRIENHMRQYRVAPARIGREAVGDPCFVFDLRRGREPRPATVARVQLWLDRREEEGGRQG